MARLIVFAVFPIMAGLLDAQPSQPQPAAKRPEFEVASIKLSRPCLEAVAFRWSSPGKLAFPCISARSLIRMAYTEFDGLGPSPSRIDVLGGPEWVDSEHYEISAKAEGNAHIAQMAGPMLQALLEDRFQLRVHKESRDMPVYALTIADRKPKLRRLEDGDCLPYDLDALVATQGETKPGEPRYCEICGISGGGLGEPSNVDCFGGTMAEFAGRTLSSVTGRPVIDKTGLTGRFDIHLEFVDPRAWKVVPNGLVVRDPAADLAGPAGPSIFEALQEQLGLKLSAGRAPVEVLVIDHVERPSEN